RTSLSRSEGWLREFQDWVKKSEDVIKKSATRGWAYRGTYGYVLGVGRFAGGEMWECNRYGDFEAWREHNDPAWVRIAEEFQEFMTEDVGESVLLREMSDDRDFETKKPRN